MICFHVLQTIRVVRSLTAGEAVLTYGKLVSIDLLSGNLHVEFTASGKHMCCIDRFGKIQFGHTNVFQ